MANLNSPMKLYLASSEFVDWNHPTVAEKAAELAQGCAADPIETARCCFEYVRDQIRHSWDFRANPVTCKASDVLLFGTGWCFAKSHLLAALLRANGIPAGLCYQRLRLEPGKAVYTLHGLNAVHLPVHGWYRVDPRGNKPGIQAEFCPPVEKLAFPIVEPAEANFREIWPEPLPVVVKALTENATYDQVFRNLPDIDVLPG